MIVKNVHSQNNIGKIGEIYMNIIFYDFRDSEKNFFKHNVYEDFDIKFVKEPLNSFTEVTEFDSRETCVISVFTTSRIDLEVLDKFKNLRLITTRSTGFDHIDIDECAKRNIAVVNVEQYGKVSVTEYTIGMIIALVRKLVPAVRDMRRQDIKRDKYLGRDLAELRLGVVGTGAIGSSVAAVANTLGMKIYAYDLSKNKEIEAIVEYVDFETLLKNSDIITLHVPYNKESYHIISSYELSIMKHGAYLINTARGELIDTVALYDAIANNKLAGCALDVQECEGVLLNMSKDPVQSVERADKTCIQRAMILQKLAESDKVIITPHIAYNTLDAVNTILDTTFGSIRDYLKGLNTNRVI